MQLVSPWFGSSVIATVEPAPVYRRVLYTFADVPLNAGRLVASQVASTALQKHQRQSQERGFDDGEHARDPLFISSRSSIPATRLDSTRGPPRLFRPPGFLHRFRACKLRLGGWVVQ